MAKRSRKIRISLHKPTALPSIFTAGDVEEFWIGKMSEKLLEHKLTQEELRQWRENWKLHSE